MHYLFYHITGCKHNLTPSGKVAGVAGEDAVAFLRYSIKVVMEEEVAVARDEDTTVAGYNFLIWFAHRRARREAEPRASHGGVRPASRGCIFEVWCP